MRHKKAAQAQAAAQAAAQAQAQAQAQAKAEAARKAAQEAEQKAAEQARAARREQASQRGYIDHGDGTVTCTQTGLMWKQCAEGQQGPDCTGEPARMDWDAAMALPKQLQHQPGFAGYADWRLPTKDELASLLMEERAKPSICTEAFPNCPPIRFWTSSPYVDYCNYAWYVYFNDGYVYGNYRGNSNAVRLVRASQ